MHWLTGACFVFIPVSPLYWNALARNEYRHQTLTKWFGSKERACSWFGSSIFMTSMVRNFIFLGAVLNEKMHFDPYFEFAGLASIALGATLVYSSMTSLGFHGTYLGDYFGILFKEKLTGFPFNYWKHPMYTGSTLCFLGVSLCLGSWAGLALTAWVALVYEIASSFEEPFTNAIYAKAAN